MNLFNPFRASPKGCCDPVLDTPPMADTADGSYTIAIVGNPNCGKTTLFNELTGARQKVGNWPGVTVDRKAGRFKDDGHIVSVVDLPGIYSLAVIPGTDALDERIGRDYILSGEPDVIVDIVDATNLERHLYLTAQLLEMRVPVVVALNMMDVARQLGIDIDAKALSKRLGCPVVPITAALGRGIDDLKAAVRDTVKNAVLPSQRPDYGPVVEPALARLIKVAGGIAEQNGLDSRWLAIKLLEGEGIARRLTQGKADLMLSSLAAEFEEIGAEDPDIMIADGRFGFAHQAAQEVVHQRGRVTRTLSDKIDNVVLHRWAGPAIFFGIIYLMFMFTINLGGAFIDFFDIAFGTVFVDGTAAALGAIGAPVWLTVLLAEGVGGGIQIVATFIPIIGFLYLFLSVLEDSGYMARAAFLTDRFMRAVGLPGKAFVPLIVGFGCNVPAIMAARTLDQARDRIVTVLMAPFMSCGARLAVYALFAAAFFPSGGQNIVFLLYIIGIAAAVITGVIVKRTLLMGEATPFIMELPAYHIPRPRGVLINAWNRLKSFVFGAGKVIVVVVIALSFLNSLGTDGSFGNQDSKNSSLSAIGRAIVPVFEPMGIEDDNWPATVGIFTGVFAKEAVVGTLDALYSGLAAEEAIASGEAAAEEEPYDLLAGLGEAVMSVPENLGGIGDFLLDPLGLNIGDVGSVDTAAEEQGVSTGTFGAMSDRFDGSAGAFAYLLFVLLYTPCVAAIGAVVREIGGRWATFVSLWTFGFAWIAAVGTYQVARFTQNPTGAIMWLGAIAIGVIGVITAMRFYGRAVEARLALRASAQTGAEGAA
ncbi:MAG: Fe(2+) transporter permease subunit FeoB [Rhodospirillales bacterium]|nr:Fe(2+) transporter permease subunit FeoB [Rhodospirillales bacterium]